MKKIREMMDPRDWEESENDVFENFLLEVMVTGRTDYSNILLQEEDWVVSQYTNSRACEEDGHELEDVGGAGPDGGSIHVICTRCGHEEVPMTVLY